MIKVVTQRYSFIFKCINVNSFVTAFHEAVVLYAIALNEAISEGYYVTNGTVITQKMWNRTFEGITGNVSVNENGDRNVDYSMLDMDPVSGNFEVVANYFGVSKEIVDVKYIHWAGDRDSPPPDVPECGFDGSKCLEEVYPHYAIISAVLSALLVLEVELASMSWKIRYEDILSTDKRKGQTKRLGSLVSVNRFSVDSSVSAETIAAADLNRQVFVKTGYYKGTVVAIKPLNKSRVEVNRSLMIEMKKVKDLQNDHIVRFIGACVDPPSMCLITEYCPKGSLQDILENEEIKLDWMFRYSLMHDIVKGMSYLHSSDIRSHGGLKSSNCVVDSRFVLKITDFGLHLLRSSDENDNEDTYVHWKRKLWTAPELLRHPNPPVEGSQRGDVYSFALIVHEIVYRQGAFYLGQHINLSPKATKSEKQEER
ncbi:atrial natriuretic peptide receptor 1-like isoform X3 [Leptotrombidium deliense]|uniref:guanylate cyclase n=1 Tax=Leptotrombidium deliense TaxID=299467 RepID=A0A443SBY9_9ACAR|nr:atrial natriuretic peptide receptor 1-like isoform X3 [Leptotrombidium deliense]